jgi:Leucine-rich repeat (LRR) protein
VLDNNQIQFLPSDVFESISRLKSIHLRNNSLEEIQDEVLAGLTIKYLDLSSNNLEEGRFLSAKHEIEYLNLTFNEFQEIDTSLLENTETDFWGESASLCDPFKPLNHDFAVSRKSFHL